MKALNISKYYQDISKYFLNIFKKIEILQSGPRDRGAHFGLVGLRSCIARAVAWHAGNSSVSVNQNKTCQILRCYFC